MQRNKAQLTSLILMTVLGTDKETRGLYWPCYKIPYTHTHLITREIKENKDEEKR